MRQLTAKEYLEQVKQKDARINNLMKDKEALRDKMYSSGSFDYSKERVQASPDQDKYGTLYAMIDEKEREIIRKIDELINFKIRVTDMINDLSDERYITVLHKKYIRFQSWEQIAIEMGYNTRYVQQLNGQALLQFYDRYHEKLGLIRKSKKKN